MSVYYSLVYIILLLLNYILFVNYQKHNLNVSDHFLKLTIDSKEGKFGKQILIISNNKFVILAFIINDSADVVLNGEVLFKSFVSYIIDKR